MKESKYFKEDKHIVLIFFILLSSIEYIYAQEKSALQNQQTYYNNPILKGMNPDPSICRVGDNYYLVTSSFGFFPGLPIYQSKDLVNWKLIGHGISNPSQLNLQTKESLNLYAATIKIS